jgi:hypothetical protein
MRRLAVLLTVGVVFGVSAGDEKPAAKYSFFTGSSISGGGGGKSYGLTGGVVVCEQKSLRPLVWFGASKPNDGKSQFLYLLIFKTPADFNGMKGFGLSGEGRGSSREGVQGTLAVEFQKKKVEVSYKFPVDPKTHAVLKQTLSVGGLEVKEGEPRVFVVDLTGEKVKYTPVKVELPKDAPDVNKERSQEWGDAIQRTIEQLKNDSGELKKLLEAK